VEERLAPGTAAPSDHLIHAVDQVTVVLGTQELELKPSFAGLTPGSVGLFQINTELTRQAPAGDSVPIYLRMRLSDGATIRSNTVTIAIQDDQIARD
jgi:uncharacterized protein (TIGR03437 family)